MDQTVNYFRAEAPFLPRFFPSGYGNPHAILSIRESFHNFKKKKKEALDSNSNPNFGDLHQLQFSAPRLKRTNSSPFSRFSNIPTKDDDNGYFIQHGSFLSPIHDTGTFTYLPHESKKAHFELLIPQSWYEGKQSTTRDNAGLCISDLVEHRPLCVLLPGTGEIGYERRRNGVAVDLAKRGIATLILEGPYYGLRKPKGQIRSKLLHVSDLPILGLTTVLEAMAILQWWKSLTPESPVCVAGVSMGGLHSCMVASLLSPIEIGCVNWYVLSLLSFIPASFNQMNTRLGPIGATPVFTEGCMAKAVDWKAMRRECDERGKIFKGLLYNEDVIEEYDCEAKQMMGLFLQDARISHFEQPVRKDTTYIIRASNDSYVPVSASDGWLHQVIFLVL